MLVITAKMPRPVDDVFARSSTAVIDPDVVLGNSRVRSRKMLSWSSGLRSTRLAMKRASSASGRSDSSRLYATMPERPVTFSE